MSGSSVRAPVASTRARAVNRSPATSTVWLSMTVAGALRMYSTPSWSLVWRFMMAWAPPRPFLNISMISRTETCFSSNSGNHSFLENHRCRSSWRAQSEKTWWGTQASWGHDPPRNGHLSMISGRPPRALAKAAPKRPAAPPPMKITS